MNKKGVGPGIIVLIVIGILVVGFLGFMAVSTPSPESITPPAGVGTCPDSTGTVSFSAVDAASKSTSVTTSQEVKVDGGTSSASTTSYAVGAELEILWNASSYEDMITTYTVPCGGGPIVGEIEDYADATVTIREDNTLLTNNINGLSSNASALGSGGSETYQIKMKGSDKDTSSSTIVVVEQNSTTACKAAEISGLDDIAIPSVAAITNTAGGKLTAFKIPAIDGNIIEYYDLTLAAKSGKVCCGGVYVTFYPEQAFEDIDGTFATGVEDSDGTAKHQTSHDYDFYIDCA